MFLSRRVLRPQGRLPRVSGLSPAPGSSLHSHVADAVLDRLMFPAARKIEVWFSRFHRFRRGLTQHHVLCILVTLLALLGMQFPFKQFAAQWFAR